MKFFDQVYSVVNQIPIGQITTYGHIAHALGTKDSRRVGHALHANPDPATPCHRVVAKDGSLAPSYAFGGEKEQLFKLQQEGITFKDENHVNLTKHLFIPTK